MLKKENEEAADSLQALLAEVWDLKTRNHHLTSLVKVSARADGGLEDASAGPPRLRGGQVGQAGDQRRVREER